MLDKTVIASIYEYRELLRRDAERTLMVERTIRSSPCTADKAIGQIRSFRELQRDYSILLRATEIMEAKVVAGCEWQTLRDDILTMEVGYRCKHSVLEQAMRCLYVEVKPLKA